MACPSPELTSNIRAMSPVTLEMSRNSGWLKLRACCRVERGTRTRRKEGACGARGLGQTRGRASEWTQGGRSGHTGGAHQEHPAHGCDARRFEAQGLIERQRGLPSQIKEGHAYKAGRGWWCKRHGRGGLVTQGLGWGGGGASGAHGEHVLHDCDVGRVKARQRLVELMRVLCVESSVG